MDRFIKQPAEVIEYFFDFTPALNTGDTINAKTYSNVVNVLGTVAGDSVPTFGTFTISASTGASVPISGGLDTYTYKVTIRVTTTLGETLEHEFLLAVKNL